MLSAAKRVFVCRAGEEFQQRTPPLHYNEHHLLHYISQNNFTHKMLTRRGLATPYGDTDLDQRWLR